MSAETFQKQLLIDQTSQTRKIRLIRGDLLIISTIVYQFQTICSIIKTKSIKMYVFIHNYQQQREND